MERSLLLPMFAVILSISPCGFAERMDSYRIGSHGTANITYPPWFKASFFDLREDLNDARAAGKRGVIVFFSQQNCQHCRAFIETTLGDPVIGPRVRARYDVVAMDIFSDVEVTYLDGSVRPVRDFAELARARLTPTLLVLGTENKALLKLVGFYPPEKFARVLDYLEGDHHQRVALADYLRQAGSPKRGQMTFDYDLFARPPHRLTNGAGTRMTLVVFDRPDCAACRRFHERVLADAQVRTLMASFQAVQLDATDETTQVITVDGRTLTPRQWSEKLQLTYDIAVVFFDEAGNEVHRLDAETGKDRMAGSLQYVQEKAYQRHDQFLRWRKEQAQRKP